MTGQKRIIHRARPFFSEEDITSALLMIEETLRSGQLTMGPLVEAFENRFAQEVGVRHAIAVSSGTAALEIGLRCVGVEGREVIVPTETFAASANAVIRSGGRPVFAEISPDTFCLDMDDVTRRITPRTAGVMLVHLAGLIMPDIHELQSLCMKRGLFLIEDAAHAHGASINGHKAGSLGKVGCFSFYPTKVLTTGEGGMITTNDNELAERAQSYRNHGANPRGADYIRVSTNWRLPEINAALGLVQVEHLDEFLERRNQIAACYDQALATIPNIKALPTYPAVRHSYWNYIALLDEGVDRVKLASVLREEFGVTVAWPYDPPCHLQPVFQDALGCRPGDLPRSEHILSRHIALPMHVGLSDEDVTYVVDALRLALSREY